MARMFFDLNNLTHAIFRFGYKEKTYIVIKFVDVEEISLLDISINNQMISDANVVYVYNMLIVIELTEVHPESYVEIIYINHKKSLVREDVPLMIPTPVIIPGFNTCSFQIMDLDIILVKSKLPSKALFIFKALWGDIKTSSAIN